MSVRTLSAVEWTCDTCHDTGLARNLPEAAEALGEHMEDYHVPTDPELVGLDRLTPDEADAFREAWQAFRTPTPDE